MEGGGSWVRGRQNKTKNKMENYGWGGGTGGETTISSRRGLGN